jgi:hypothetical protein
LVEHAPVWLLRLILESNPEALTPDAIDKTINYEDYDKIKLVFGYFRRIRTTGDTFDDLISLERFDLVKRILEDYSDLFNDFTLSAVLVESLVNDTKSALELKEYVFDLIEETNRYVEPFVIGSAIGKLDINTVTRVLNMKQLNLDDYKYEVKQTYHNLTEGSKTNPEDAIAMIKVLDDYYNITQDKELVIAAAVSIPVLEFLLSRPNSSRLLLQNAPALLLHAENYANKDVVEYIIKVLGPYWHNLQRPYW